MALLIMLSAACDSTDPVEEDLTATRVALTLEDSTASDTISWSAVESAGLVNGVSLAEDTLVLTGGVTFSGRLEFFGTADLDLTRRIRNEAERYQLFYAVSELDGLHITVEDTETDYGTNEFGIDLPVGLVVTVTTPETESTLTGSLRVRVGYFPPRQKNGFTLTVDPVYDFVIPVRIMPVEAPPVPPPAAHVTRFRLDLIRWDDLKTISITAERPNGLNMFGAQIPSEELDIEVCERETEDETFTCTNFDELTVYRDEHFDGYATVGDEESGDAFTDRIRMNLEEFRIIYEFQFAPTGLTYDVDANGLPVGLEIFWQVPNNIEIGGGRLTFRVLEYDSEWGGSKENHMHTARLVDFRIPFNLSR